MFRVKVPYLQKFKDSSLLLPRILVAVWFPFLLGHLLVLPVSFQIVPFTFDTLTFH